MFPEVERILIDEGRIAARVRELGGRIAADLQAECDRTGANEIVLVPVLTGSMVFAADLIRCMPVKLSLDVVAVSSYPGASTASRGPSIRGQISPGLGGKHVLVIDDILDSGRTLGLVRRLVAEQGPASLRTCVLLRKSAPRAEEVPVEYVGFDIPDEFVVGYGLDYNGHYRNLPGIGIIKGTRRGGGGGV
jgi:hypoxanthine phosphoribosyltransferase